MTTEQDNSDSTVPLPRSQQTRNLLLFAACTGLIYLAAPVLYVGITQASLCDRLGASARVANLPATAFFAMTAMPVLLAWLLPSVRLLKRNLRTCYLIIGGMLGIVAAGLVPGFGLSDRGRIALVVIQGGVSGAAMPAAIAYLWEVVGRGVDGRRRGVVLGLAFGAGPFLAFASSLASQLVLNGQLGPWQVPVVDRTFLVTLPGMDYPWNFIALFAGGVPVMLLAAWLAGGFVVPPPDREPVRGPVSEHWDLLGGMLLGGISLVLLFNGHLLSGSLAWFGFIAAFASVALFVRHFRDILANRLLLCATLVTILLYVGNTIPSNMNLYTKAVLGDSPEAYAGFQNCLRFGFKGIAGALLGWLLVRTHPKAGLLATALLFIAAQVWAIWATGMMYLVAFGIYGMGELIGVYAPNYILSASRPDRYRRNMAFVTMLMAPAAPAGYLFGAIADRFAESGRAAAGFRWSFAVCAVIMAAGVVLAVVTLPNRPRPVTDRSRDS